jgi:hypothetical protein
MLKSRTTASAACALIDELRTTAPAACALKDLPSKPVMMKTPRFEGDQEVTIPESNLTDAAKGSGNVPLLAFSEALFSETSWT